MLRILAPAVLYYDVILTKFFCPPRQLSLGVFKVEEPLQTDVVSSYYKSHPSLYKHDMFTIDIDWATTGSTVFHSVLYTMFNSYKILVLLRDSPLSATNKQLLVVRY